LSTVALLNTPEFACGGIGFVEPSVAPDTHFVAGC
jgi:hypothetical protein